MPLWVQIVLGAAALTTAAGVLWTKVVRPLVHLIAGIEQTVPLLRQLTEVFGDHPDTFNVIYDIASQFRNNGGSTLRDVVNRLDEAAATAEAASQRLEVAVATAKEVATNDRQQVHELVLLLDRLIQHEMQRTQTADEEPEHDSGLL